MNNSQRVILQRSDIYHGHPAIDLFLPAAFRLRPAVFSLKVSCYDQQGGRARGPNEGNTCETTSGGVRWLRESVCSSVMLRPVDKEAPDVCKPKYVCVIVRGSPRERTAPSQEQLLVETSPGIQPRQGLTETLISLDFRLYHVPTPPKYLY